MNKKLVCLITCIVFVIGMSAGAYAASNPEIKAILNYGIKIEVNGTEFVPTDTDGSKLTPITYNGRTYLPVRSLADALSVAVDYENSTVYLGERGKTPLASKDYSHLWSSQFTTDQDLLLINDVQYKSGIVYTGTDGYYTYGGFIYPNGKYQKFGGVACMEDNDNSTDEVIIKILENDYEDRVLKEITLENGEFVSFEIDIANVKTLYVQNLVSDRTPKSTNPDIMMIADPYFN